MKKYICLKETFNFPKCKKGKEYYGTLDEDADLWLIDEFWYEKVEVINFNIKEHGTYVSEKNRKYFEEIK